MSDKITPQQFYKNTTKQEMCLIVEQFALLLKSDEQSWMDKANEEKRILYYNGMRHIKNIYK